MSNSVSYNKAQAKGTEGLDESNGSNATPPSAWPCHARKGNKSKG